MSHIERDQRGIWLDWKLAWTFAAGLIAAGLWLGITLTDLSSKAEETQAQVARIESRMDEERNARRQVEARLAIVERTESRTDQRLINLERGVNRIVEWVDRQEGRP